MNYSLRWRSSSSSPDTEENETVTGASPDEQASQYRVTSIDPSSNLSQQTPQQNLNRSLEPSPNTKIDASPSKVSWYKRWIDPRSLQFRLGATLATLITMGLSGVALWTTWRVQQILIDSHKESIVGIGERIAQDVNLYGEMMTVDESVQRALDNRSTSKLLLWVQKKDGSLFAASPHSHDAAWHQLKSPRAMAAVFNNALPPRIFRVDDRDYVACESPISVNNEFEGELFIAQDITQDQQRFEAVVKAQVATTISAIILMTVIMVFYLNRSLRPLQNMCRVTQNISAEDLENSQLNIHQAPTEIQQLADRFNLMLARLSNSWKKEQNSSTRQRQFVSNVSHELRTPLTIVQGYLQSTLRRGSNLSEAQREALDIASEEATHTIQVLQDLLDLARAEDGNIPYRMDHVILNDIVQKVANRVEQARNRDIQVKGLDELVSAYTDETRLQQVLVNLIDNAVKYSSFEAPVIVSIQSSETYVTIEVCDHGPGIPEELHDRIFERFYRVDEARTRSGGTGLGLSIVKTFVEGMHGHVSLSSTENKGSTFTITLPTMPPKA